MTPTLIASPEDMAVTVELAIPRAARLPTCKPIVALPLSACTPAIDWTQVALDLLDECRFSAADCAAIGAEAERLHRRCPDMSPEGAVEDAVLEGRWL